MPKVINLADVNQGSYRPFCTYLAGPEGDVSNRNNSSRHDLFVVGMRTSTEDPKRIRPVLTHVQSMDMCFHMV